MALFRYIALEAISKKISVPLAALQSGSSRTWFPEPACILRVCSAFSPGRNPDFYFETASSKTIDHFLKKIICFLKAEESLMVNCVWVSAATHHILLNRKDTLISF
jgi:hypothetical protein